MKKHIYINIYLAKIGFVPAGVISFDKEKNFSCFSYFPSYIEKNYPPLNPSTLNWRSTNQRHFIVNPNSNKQLLDRTFWELLPNESDWANQILISKYPEYQYMKNIEKLYFLSNRIVGGLHSYVKELNDEESIKGLDWLEKVHDESIEFHLRNIEKISYVKAINPMTSYGGARPKCMFEDDNGELWIAKFNLPSDPYDMAIGEQIALDMARDSGLEVSDSKIIQLPNGENVFLSKRFDRVGEKRYHSLSLFALAPGNEIQRNPKHGGNPGTYMHELVLKYTDFADKHSHDIVLKLMLDLGINNTDNHLRNTRIILDENNKWKIAPIYDVIFNPNNQSHTYNPGNLPINDLFLNNPDIINHLSKEYKIDKEFFNKSIKKIKSVTENLDNYCKKYNATAEDKAQFQKAINLGLNRKDYTVEMKKEPIKVIPKPKMKP